MVAVCPAHPDDALAMPMCTYISECCSAAMTVPVPLHALSLCVPTVPRYAAVSY